MARLEKHIEIFKNLRADRKQTHWTSLTLHQSPYKPLLLLAVLDLYAEGEIITNLVEPSPSLEKTFYSYLLLVDPSVSKPDCIVLPFWSLQRDGFWRLIPRSDKDVAISTTAIPSSITHLRGSYLGAELDNELYSLITAENHRKSLRLALIGTYFSLTIQDKLVTAIAKKASFQKAVQALRDGDRRHAYRMSVEAIKEDRKNINAWYFLSQLVTKKAHKLDCLHRVLKLSPDHEGAIQALAMLESDSSNAIYTSFSDIEGAQEATRQVEHEPEIKTLNLRNLVQDWVSPLTYTEQTVINHLYLNAHKFSMESVGRVTSSSPKRLAQIYEGALSKLGAEDQYGIIKPFVKAIFKMAEDSATPIVETNEIDSLHIVHNISPVDVATLIRVVQKRVQPQLKRKASVQRKAKNSNVPEPQPSLDAQESPTLALQEGYVVEYDFSQLKNDTTPIKSLQLSARIVHALNRAGIETIGQLANLYPKSDTPEGRWLAPGIGPNSVKEIGKKLLLYVSNEPSSPTATTHSFHAEITKSMG